MGKLIDEFRRGWHGNIPAVAAFQHWICGILPRAVDRGAVGPFPDPAGRILHAVFSGRGFCHRVRRLPGRDRHRAGRRPARRVRQFRRHDRRFRAVGAAADLLGGLRPDDMGRRALSIDRSRISAEIAKRLIREEAVSQAGRRRTAAPAEEQIIDNSRRSASGAARSAADLGQHRSAAAGAVRDRRPDRQGRRHAVATSRICCSPNSGLTDMSGLP